MIKELDITDRKNAKEVLSIQIPAYSVEADLIGSKDIPPLHDSIESLQQCEERFFGYYQEKKLCGVISIVNDEEIDIHRLMVHPDHFKKGIAQQLLNYIENKFEFGLITVSTGSKNSPAIHFYQKNGFKKVREVAVNEHLSLTFFRKTKEI